MPSQLQNSDSYQFAYSHLQNWLYVANTYYWGRSESTIKRNSAKAFFYIKYSKIIIVIVILISLECEKQFCVMVYNTTDVSKFALDGT